MSNFLAALSSLLRSLLAVGVAGFLGFGGWVGYQTYYAHDIELRDRDARLAQLDKDLAQKTARIAALDARVVEQDQQIESLETALRFLKVDHRVAQIAVVDQTPATDDSPSLTSFRFVEVDAGGEPLEEPQLFTIEGDLLYVDAWVVKFDDEHVEADDPLRSTSICLFRRLFGEFQQPNEGFELDGIGSRPRAYSRGDDMTDLERDLWENFWDYANQPQRAAELGVRAAHGEAPSMRLRPDKLYRLVLRASDGLSIIAEDVPAALDARFN